MSWAGLTANQVVSIANLKDAVNTFVFITGASGFTGASGSQELLKRDAGNYVYIDTSNVSYTVKASNQLIVKNDLTPGITGGPTQSSIYIENTSLDIILTAITLNGVNFIDLILPIPPGSNSTGYSTFMGSGATITITFGATVSGQHTALTDSAMVSSCIGMPISSPYSFTAVVAGATQMYMDIGDGACV
jgi:hypothetical protein